MSKFTNRTLRRSLRDTMRIVDDLDIENEEVISVSVDRWGDAEILLNPDGFIRVFSAANVPRSTIVAHFGKNGSLYPSFSARNTNFTTLANAGTKELDMLLEHCKPLEPTA